MSGLKKKSQDSKFPDVQPKKKCRAEFSEQPANCTPGKIKKILVTNFMCHDKLEFVFGDRINFISGKNGSGKSAILTAIILGLGGKVTDTNRGSSLSSFIKFGKSRCTIKITLSNAQERLSRPYRHDEYGDEITIVRSMTDKTSTYRLLANDGSVVEKSFGELKKMLRWYNIQISNPVSILTQETARTFLTSADPKKLYDFFIKGTLMEDIKRKFNLIIEEKIPMVESTLEGKKKQLDIAFKDIMETKKTLDKLQELYKCSSEIEDLKKELEWAEVNRLEIIIEEGEKNKAEAENELEKLRKIVEEREVVETDLGKRRNNNEKELSEIKTKIEALEKQIEENQKDSQNMKRNKEKIIIDTRRLNRQILHEENNCKMLEIEIEKERSLDKEAEARRVKKEEERKKILDKISEMKAIKKVNENDYQQFTDTVLYLREIVNEKNIVSEGIKSRLENKVKHLRALERDDIELSVYSPWMSEFVKKLSDEHKRGRLSEMPVGPIGRYLKVTEKEWTPPIEGLLTSRFLQTFIINAFEDWEIFKEVGEKCKIPFEELPEAINMQFCHYKQYDTTQNEARHHLFKNLLDIMIFSDPLVANAIIDNKEIESVLLIPSLKDACDYLATSPEKVPKNCKKALTLEGDLIYPLPGYRFYSGPKDPKEVKYLQVNKENVIRNLKEEILKLNDELKVVENVLEKEQIALNNAETRRHSLRKTGENLIREISRNEADYHKLDIEEDITDININTLKEEIEYRKGLICQWEHKIKENDTHLTFLEQKVSNCQVIIKEGIQLKKELLEKKNFNESELQSIKREINSINKDWKAIQYKFEQKKKSTALISQELLKNKDSFKLMKKRAEEICQRMNDTQEIPALKSRISELENKKKILEDMLNGVVIPPTEEYQDKLDIYEKSTKVLEDIYSVKEEVKIFLEHLKNKYQRLKSLTCSTVKNLFQAIIGIRGYKGNIIFNHEVRELVISIKTDQIASVSDPSGLSGGERSFCMVSFIMALWKNMDLPFYCLDEFDVFMDPVNRRTALHLLVDHAKDRPQHQFIFLTPQDLNSSKYKLLKCSIEYYRLEDPRPL